MIRVISIALAFVALTLVLLPSQLIGMAFDLRLQRTVPHLYHRILCALIGVRIRQIGRRSAASPVLILSNHVSWLDISVISALAPVVFVAKSEVAGWPVLGWLATLQRTVFINRRARHQIGAATRQIADRLLGGDAVVLFAEGTSSGFSGVPIGRGLRERVAWYGDADLVPHLLHVLSSGGIDVTVSWGEAVAYDISADRKAIARDTERSVRRMTATALRGAPPEQTSAAESAGLARPQPKPA